MVYQQNEVAHMKRIPVEGYRWLGDVECGLSLSELFDRHSDFDFIHWLSEAAQGGVLDGLD